MIRDKGLVTGEEAILGEVEVCELKQHQKILYQGFVWNVAEIEEREYRRWMFMLVRVDPDLTRKAKEGGWWARGRDSVTLIRHDIPMGEKFVLAEGDG